MQNNKTYSDSLYSLVKTREQANMMLSEIEELEKTIFKTEANLFETTLNTKVRATTADFVKAAIVGQDKSEFLKNVKEQINSLKYLELTIAFEPTLETLGRISDWARQNIIAGICLDIRMDKRIIGGAIVNYNGKLKDYSLVNQIDAYFSVI